VATKLKIPAGQRLNRGENSPAIELVRRGNLLRLRGNMNAAEAAYREASQVDEKCDAAWAELGCLFTDCRRFTDAVDCFRRLLNLPPSELEEDADGKSAMRQAIELLERIAAPRRGWFRAPLTLGAAYEQLGDHAEARRHLKRAAKLDPGRYADAEAMSARMHMRDQEYSEALAAAERAINADPRNFLAHVIRSRSYSYTLRMEEAIRSLRTALEIRPDVTFHSCLVFDSNYLPETTPESLYADARCWNAVHAAPLAAKIRPHLNSPDPDRVLKIGYVSPDLYNHPMMRFLPPVLERHNTQHFEVFVYSVGAVTDVVTERLYKSDNYIRLRAPEAELAERIRADKIDILVDLAGHTMGPPLLAFAMKPAPIQITWMGVLSTTGMDTIDYFLGDAYMPSPGTDHLFSETVCRLPRPSFCYRPIVETPVTDAPCLKNGYTTFGSFNNPRKITGEVVKLWSAILHLCPGSRLHLKYHRLDNEAVTLNLRNWFRDAGIGEDRLRFSGPSIPSEYFAAYGGIDVGLDPFPYNGGTTTLDATWMGVPVVTLAGRLAMQRAGASVLGGLGLTDLIAHTPEQYIKIALYLADASAKVPDLRRNLRETMKSSPIMDEAGLVRHVEYAYRDMWRKWCRERGAK